MRRISRSQSIIDKTDRSPSPALGSGRVDSGGSERQIVLVKRSMGSKLRFDEDAII